MHLKIYATQELLEDYVIEEAVEEQLGDYMLQRVREGWGDLVVEVEADYLADDAINYLEFEEFYYEDEHLGKTEIQLSEWLEDRIYDAIDKKAYEVYCEERV